MLNSGPSYCPVGGCHFFDFSLYFFNDSKCKHSLHVSVSSLLLGISKTHFDIYDIILMLSYM